jgi:hypothetical protein
MLKHKLKVETRGSPDLTKLSNNEQKLFVISAFYFILELR